MQFYLNGYTNGDPAVLPVAPGAMAASERLADEVDVLIVGCGPAGLVLAAQLAAFPDIKTRIVDRRPGPLELGQADGVACRTVEMFNAFGFAERLLRRRTGSTKRSSGSRTRMTGRRSSAAGGSRTLRMACPSART